jgi:hypothetical protein
MPALWLGIVPEHQRAGDLVAAYYHLLRNTDPTIRTKAAQDWHDWEAASISIDPNVKVWKDGELVVIDNAGRSPADPGMSEAIIAATDRFADKLSG